MNGTAGGGRSILVILKNSKPHGSELHIVNYGHGVLCHPNLAVLRQ
jgi:hypothetical protein